MKGPGSWSQIQVTMKKPNLEEQTCGFYATDVNSTAQSGNLEAFFFYNKDDLIHFQMSNLRGHYSTEPRGASKTVPILSKN
jgi:hypothetical protein